MVSHPARGAWIEMGYSSVGSPIFVQSHPSRVRGLKWNILVCPSFLHWSHPSRVRGLK